MCVIVLIYTDLILRVVRRTASRRADAGTISPVAVLRDTHTSALLKEVDDINMIRTSETLY
jgi:hypothetical protein